MDTTLYEICDFYNKNTKKEKGEKLFNFHYIVT